MATISGGKRLASALAKIATNMNKPSLLRVGFLEGAKYPDGTPIGMIAAIQNYGAPRAGIPPRPFFTNMIAEKKKEWPDAIANLLKTNNYDAEITLKITGASIAGQLRQSIVDTNEPPLKEATIRRKGFSKPLVDTKRMFKSISFEVNGKGK